MKVNAERRRVEADLIDLELRDQRLSTSSVALVGIVDALNEQNLLLADIATSLRVISATSSAARRL